MKTSVVTLLSLAILVAGCGDSDVTTTGSSGSSTTTATSTSTGAASSGGLYLLVETSAEASNVSGMSASQGHIFLVLYSTLANQGIKAGISESYKLFSVVLQSGEQIPASPLTETLQDGCDATTIIAENTTGTCTTIFDIPADAVPLSLRYDDVNAGVFAIAAVPPLNTMAQCIPVATFQAAPMTCQSCIDINCSGEKSAFTSDAACTAAFTQCTQMGGPSCATCDCEHACLGAQADCAKNYETCVAAFCFTQCGG
jgi:hypothetical protein